MDFPLIEQVRGSISFSVTVQAVVHIDINRISFIPFRSSIVKFTMKAYTAEIYAIVMETAIIMRCHLYVHLLLPLDALMSS
jgi:hypothetical protein